MHRQALIAVPLLLAACGSDPAASPDATMPRTDSGAAVDGGRAFDGGGPDAPSDAGPVPSDAPPEVLFYEPFEDPRLDLNYGFDGYLFGWSDLPWMREHLPTGGVNNSGNFRTTSTFDSYTDHLGASYRFNKNFTGMLADHNRDFWVRQCMKYSEGFIDARVLPRPENPKINYFVATNGGFLHFAMTAGAFLPRERVVGQSSGARADFFLPSATWGRATNIVGAFSAGETIVGQTSGATAVFSSYDPQWRNMQLNHFWHPGDPGDGSRGDNYLELRWSDQTTGDYFPANDPRNQVQHANWLLLQDHYEEWMCLETHFDLDQVPWVVDIYVTTAPGAAALASGTTAIDSSGRRQFNDYLYIRYSNPVAPALEPGFGIDWNEYGAYGSAMIGDQIYYDEYLISTGKAGHPF